jgi:large subunit ribosomal protein L30e
METQNYTDVITKAVIDNNAIIGAKNTIKKLKTGKISKIYVASNIAKMYDEDIEYYAQLANVQVQKIPFTAAELGILCKKPFHITVLGIL